MADESTRSLGLGLSAGDLINGRPVPVLIIESPWQNPLRAILTISGWTIDQVVSSKSVAASVRLHWRVHNELERRARRSEQAARLRAEQADLEMQIQWRWSGMPVPCPWCQSLAPCRCDGQENCGRRSDRVAVARADFS